MDDAELVRQVLQGNLGAYVDLVNRYTAQVAALCRAQISRPEVVDDLVQEAFLRGLDRLTDLREPGSFGYWLYSIARNLCRDWLNDPHHEFVSLNGTTAQVVAPAGTSEDDRGDRIADLRTCIRHLPVELREIVEVYYSGGRVTYQEIADRLGVSFGKVNQMLTHARKTLRCCMERSQASASVPAPASA